MIATLSRWLVVMLSLAGALEVAAADPPSHEPAGAALYRRYCASCHGVTAKGDGPVATELRTAPTDLTMLKRANHGRFDSAGVMAAIDGRRQVAAHGSREMPVWGAIFSEELKDQPYREYTTLLHAKSLAEYLEALQIP